MKIFIYAQHAIKLLILVAMFAIPIPSFAESMAIFTASDQFTPLSSGKAKMLFKGKVKRLNNKRYSLIDWPAGSPTKVKFYLHLTGQSEARINAVRAKLIFSGKGFPPKVMSENNIEVLKSLLKSNANSIGYAPVSMISEEFNILFIFQAGNDNEN